MKLFGKKETVETAEQNRRKEQEFKEKISKVEEISPNQYKNIVQGSHESGHHHSHHHHHHHSNEEAAEKNRELLTDFSSDEIQKRTDEYTGSHRIDRATPKHPHPHDKIAHDSKYSDEELDELNADRIGDFKEIGVEEFRKRFDENLSKSSGHHHYQTVKSTIESRFDDIPENFDADKFLSDFQKKGSGHSHHHSSHHHSSSHHHHSSSSHHHSSSSSHHHSSSSSHHHSSSKHHHSHSRDNEVTSMSEVNTQNFYDEYQKTIEEKERQKKQERLDKIRAAMSE